MTAPITRRRTLTIAASMAGLGVVPWLAGIGGAAAGELRRWRGTALGAKATILLNHPDGAAAERLIGACIAEITRLEKVFSLYRGDSALSALNRDGVLADPPPDLVRLMAESRRISELSAGAFDVTVQPLWRLYAAHFSEPGADPKGPPAQAIAQALSLVDYGAVTVDSGRIALARPGMAVTLNGIAQGYITDRVAELLRRAGADRVLIDLGEARGLGTRPNGRPWRVGLADPHDPTRMAREIDIVDAAVATSGGYGTRFDPAGRYHHLFDPATGHSSHRFLSVSVVAPEATLADGAATALTIMPIARAQGFLDSLGSVRAYLTMADGTTVTRRATT